ncbi:DNA invertase Pin-like site-specific DNA recombinase [Bradyrhizobium huanghuaihaiense]|uniref:DNA invertase Pin-like site-specific DNA recombinase n=1 Tax=Bradyrhizobium huanghuaihaiense TaxID=990078 RepID=A0A562S5S9_9BRAD|nr:recombinase family protein [Bradyrhizobium huanghuaihaiense]TWI76483.1 DNA invertase Pin-like site-specific DNA recombinase [Bradyrhizobium huanghuaihaiense]
MSKLEVAHNKPWEQARFGLYGRVSTPEQKDALEAQMSDLRTRVLAKNGVIVAELSDVGTGRRSKQRRGYQQLYQLIEKREIDYLLTRDLSRLSRDLSNLDQTWRFCHQNGVVIFDTQVGVVNELYCWALGLVAKLMPSIGAEQVRTSLAVKARKGLHLGRPPLGYECVEVAGEKGHLKVVDEDAKIVKRIFARALAGWSLRGQARALNFEDGVKSPRGSRWSSEAVRYILSNPVYRSTILWGRTKTYFHAISEAFQREDRPEAEWIRSLGSHEPLATEADFDSVQAILAGNKSGTTNKKRGPAVFLSSLIKCPKCGRPDEHGHVHGGSMSVVGGDGRRLRMRCINANAGKCDNNRTFYRDHILQAVLQGLIDHLRSPEALTMFIEAQNTASKRRLEEIGTSRRKTEKRIKTLDTEIKRLTDHIAKGLSATALGDGIKLRETETRELIARLEDIENSSVTFELKPPSLAEYADMAERMMANVSTNSKDPGDVELSEHLEALVKHVYVHPLVENGKKTFEVEVFGKLATLVTGSLSYRAQHCKGKSGKDILTQDTITVARAAQKLVMALPRKRGSGRKPPRKQVLRRLEPDLARILSRSAVPLTASGIVSKLAEEGIQRTVTAVHNALDRRPETFVRIRKNGFMLRSRWARQSVRYFTRTAEIVAMAREVLEESRKPMQPDEIIGRFHEEPRSRRIYGDDELAILRTVLSKHADDFEAKGRQHARWILRASSDFEPSTALAA